MPASAPDLSSLPGQGRVILAFSGGPDSVCLLHQLTRADLERELVCVHVDHGLDSESGERASRATVIAAHLGVDCRAIPVEVDTARGTEAGARRARYRAFESLMVPGDTLVTAHHADDQAETILLRLLRGAGPDGLSGIPAKRRFGPGWLARPLLDWTRSDIEDWLKRHGLDCIRDPANDCPDFDRNFLRREVLPALRERWPGADSALRRSARLCGGAAQFIDEQIARDLDRAQGCAQTLALERLSSDSDYYRGAAIRAWCIRQAVAPPPGRRLDTFLEQLSSAAGDRCPESRWDDARLRYWRQSLWLQTGEDPPRDWRLEWDGTDPLQLPAGLGVVKLTGAPGPPLELVVRSGQPGDSLRPAGDASGRDCKRLLAEAGVPPWQRDCWPRMWLDDHLVALGSRWLAAEFRRLLEKRGQSLVWQPGPRCPAAVESAP